MSSLKAVSSPDAPKPLAMYSQAIVTGNQVHLAGQLGQDPKTGKLVEGGIEAQSAQIIKNIEAVLKAAGSGMNKLVMRRMYFTDIKTQRGPTAELWAKILKEPYPASTAIQVGALAMDGALIEIDVVAEIS